MRWPRRARDSARRSTATGARRAWPWAAATVYRPGIDERVVPAIRGMKSQIDRALRGRDTEASTRNVKLGRGGIREIEFVVQALQLLYGGDDPWLRERNSLKALFRLTERGYLAPDLGRRLSHALVHLRTVEHRLQIVHEFQTHTLPDDPVELGRLARRVGIEAPRRRRSAGAVARRAAGAARLAGRPRRARGPPDACGLPGGAGARVRAGYRCGRGTRPAAADQAGTGADGRLALPARRHDDRGVWT